LHGRDSFRCSPLYKYLYTDSIEMSTPKGD
jgi:hypothetical protein